MADLSITPAQVLRVSGNTHAVRFAGEALSAGDVIYLKAADGKFWKADANAAGMTAPTGLALNSAAVGQPVACALSGSRVTLGAGAAPAKGTVYCLSANVGKIAPLPVAGGSTVSILGVGDTANVLALNIVNSGIAA